MKLNHGDTEGSMSRNRLADFAKEAKPAEEECVQFMLADIAPVVMVERSTLEKLIRHTFQVGFVYGKYPGMLESVGEGEVQ